jgi:hypothetical protein
LSSLEGLNLSSEDILCTNLKQIYAATELSEHNKNTKAVQFGDHVFDFMSEQIRSAPLSQIKTTQRFKWLWTKEEGKAREKLTNLIPTSQTCTNLLSSIIMLFE